MSIETSPQLPRRLDNIQALRGVAALSVLFYHLALFIRDGIFTGQSGFPAGPWDQGWAGVDLFFVVSGFIMVWTTRDIAPSIRSSADFLWRRVTRIYPLWWICAGIMLVYFMLAYNMPAAPDRVSGPGEAWAYALKSFALFPQENPPLLGLGWTLIHEMWFYLVFTVILVLPKKYLIPALLLWAFATMIHYAFSGAIEAEQAVRKLITSPINLEFIGGAIVAWMLLNRPPVSQHMGRAIFLVGLAWLTLAMVFNIRFAAEDHHLIRTVIYGPAMIFLVWGSTVLALSGGVSVPKWLIQLGDWSYALYLIHYIVLIAMKRGLEELGLSNMLGGGGLAIIIFSLAAIAFSLIASGVLHTLVERPLIRWFRRRKSRSPVQMSG